MKLQTYELLNISENYIFQQIKLHNVKARIESRVRAARPPAARQVGGPGAMIFTILFTDSVPDVDRIHHHLKCLSVEVLEPSATALGSVSALL